MIFLVLNRSCGQDWVCEDIALNIWFDDLTAITMYHYDLRISLWNVLALSFVGEFNVVSIFLL